MAGGFALYNIWGTMQLERASLSPAIQRRRFKTASYSLLCGVFTALLITTALTLPFSEAVPDGDSRHRMTISAPYFRVTSPAGRR